MGCHPVAQSAISKETTFRVVYIADQVISNRQDANLDLMSVPSVKFQSHQAVFFLLDLILLLLRPLPPWRHPPTPLIAVKGEQQW